MKRKSLQFELILIKPIINSLAITFFIFSLITSCKKETELSQSVIDAQSQSPDLSTAKWGLPDIIVHKGESIQSAIDKAKKGMVISIEPGIYKEAIFINKPGIKLIGKLSFGGDEVIIKNPGNKENGIAVSNNGDGFVLANVTVKDFEQNGVSLDSTDNFLITNVTAVNNKQYGIAASHSTNGVVEFCSVKGSSDTGIHIEESSAMKVFSNTTYANVTGIEVANSSDVEVKLNDSHNNVTGLTVDLLPGRETKTSSNIHVWLNHIYDNNHVNFATDTTQLESHLPVGMGVLVLGTDKTVVENNTINNNDFSGIIVFSSLVLTVIADVLPSEFEGMEPNPDGVKIKNNSLKHNGKNPPLIPNLPLPGVDLLYDGSGTDNCWKNNDFKTSYPSPLPSCN